MENRYVLFHVALVLNILILIVSFTGVISSPAKASIIQKPNIIEVMKNDTNLCAASKCLYESEYAKLCASLPYPTVPLDFNEQNLNIFLCLGLYDAAYKICQYSSQNSNTTILTLNLEKFVLNATLKKEKDFCVNLQGFTSSYNQIDSYLKTLIEMLKELNKCQKMCFDFDDKLKPLCAVFAWIKKYDDKKANRTGTKQNFVINETTSNKIEYKTIEANEMKESNEEKYRNNNKLISNISENSNVEKTSLNVTQTESTIHAELDMENEKSDDEKLNKAQKKLNTDLKTSAHKSSPLLHENKKIDETETVKIVKPIKTILPIPPSDLQVSSMNNPTSNVPKKDISKEKGEEFKEENSDDLKTSTLSENTQDYIQDVKNSDGDIDTTRDIETSNIEDTDKDTNQQSTGNQNENAESSKQENLRNPNIRTEDDSHFFTYFTVITVACIAGYIGYHNKQKILAIVLEGRRSRSNRSRRRPSTANYRKLDCTLEEAVTSQCNANVTHVIY
ncbi:uncharacterized protein LOC105251992 [Camponotus floridanus]|uniref:uncharacterized protein LOC105251992 n=1 Tax=Camponotus floridanus TaxID=104421 RepID=UPI000DC68758|nr:uncharacterized protein LOC105251992 [Camponotus floridanus]